MSYNRDEFIQITEPVIRWLNENAHPHMSVIITTTDAEMLEGVLCHKTDEFIKN